MSSKFWMCLLLVLACCVSCICNTPPWKSARVEAKRNPEKQFKYLRLALVLSSTFRLANPSLCKQNPKNLIISGFHPVRAEYLGLHEIDEKTLDKIKDELLVYWPVMKSPKGKFDYRYYERKYRNDGRRCDGLFNGERYFSKAIELTKLHRQKIYEALSLYGTAPSTTAKYNASDILKAIRGYTHQQPQITCYKINGILYLYEIMVCFDNLGRGFVNCHHEIPPKNCRNNKMIIIPPVDE